MLVVNYDSHKGLALWELHVYQQSAALIICYLVPSMSHNFRNGNASSVIKFQICRSQVAIELMLLLLANALTTFPLRIHNSSPILGYRLLKLFSKTNRKHQKYPNLPASSVFSSFLMLLLHLILTSSLLLKCFHERFLR